MNELNTQHNDHAVQAIEELSPAQTEQISGGAYTRIVGPSGAVYYIGYGKVGVEDPKTGTCRWL